MKSPFPGMDPYLEAFWGDVHTRLIVYACEQLGGQMPPGLRVRAQEHVTVDEGSSRNGDSASRVGFYPDVRVLERPSAPPTPASPPAVTAASFAEALVVPMALDEETRRSIHILDTASGNRVVTVIEFLSPSNKNDARKREDYQEKQRHMIRARVNLVEIDLLRSGPYVLAAPAHVVPLPYLNPYRVCVVRGSAPRQAEVYRVSLRERLPVIRVPLRPNDPDTRLDLQELIDRCYQTADYGADIDYRQAPVPPLQGDDADWADALLREKGLRP